MRKCDCAECADHLWLFKICCAIVRNHLNVPVFVLCFRNLPWGCSLHPGEAENPLSVPIRNTTRNVQFNSLKICQSLAVSFHNTRCYKKIKKMSWSLLLWRTCPFLCTYICSLPIFHRRYIPRSFTVSRCSIFIR